MWSNFNKLNSRKHGQLEPPFKFDDKGHTKDPICEENKVTDFGKNL